MSCRQSNVGTSPYPVPGKSCARATAKSHRPSRPASPAALRARSMDSTCGSNPRTDEAGWASARMRVDAPRPQPTSATAMPAASRSANPVTAGTHELSRFATADDIRGWIELLPD
jgi:hypothetical protein